MPVVREHWSTRASCLREDPELFFPLSETGLALEQISLAKRVCSRCPVAAECLRYALDNGERTGIWGGTTPHERRTLRRTRA